MWEPFPSHPIILALRDRTNIKAFEHSFSLQCKYWIQRGRSRQFHYTVARDENGVYVIESGVFPFSIALRKFIGINARDAMFISRATAVKDLAAPNGILSEETRSCTPLTTAVCWKGRELRQATDRVRAATKCRRGDHRARKVGRLIVLGVGIPRLKLCRIVVT